MPINLVTYEELLKENDNLKKRLAERKYIEEELLAAREGTIRNQFQPNNTLDNLKEGCQIIGFDWRYIYINKMAENHNKRPREELIGEIYMDMWPGIEDTYVFKVIKNCLERRETQHIENEFVFPDGSHGWFDLSIQPVPEGVFILSINITDKKLNELQILQKNEEIKKQNSDYKKINSELKKTIQKLEDSEFHFRSLVENAPDAIFIQTDWKFAYLNHQALKLFGVKKQEQLIGTLVLEKFHSDYHEKIKKRIVGLNEKFQPQKNAELKIVKVDGTLVDVETSGIPFRYNGKSGALVFAREITERKLHESDLKLAKEEAEQSARLKTAFLQNMSHEIRTPLNSIIGFSGMLNKYNLSEDKRESFTNIIQSSSQQLLTIVNDILTISSIETKQEKVIRSKVNVNKVVIDLYTLFRNQLKNPAISIRYKHELTDLQSEIYTDKVKLIQILTNLISNAIKFTHEGSVEYGYKLKYDHLEFYIKDTGIGIPPDLKDKIFERFRQADDAVNRRYGGTGLGLSISKGFTELLGGQIWVESELNKGSTFYFTLPYNPANDINDTSPYTKQSIDLKTVLVAEDEDNNFLLIEELLVDMDLKLIHTKDGIETIEICKRNPDINLILMDIKMPNLDGYTAAKRIKKFQPNLPIIAQSAYAMNDEIEKYSVIFDDYITKPINEEILKKKILKYFA